MNGLAVTGEVCDYIVKQKNINVEGAELTLDIKELDHLIKKAVNLPDETLFIIDMTIRALQVECEDAIYYKTHPIVCASCRKEITYKEYSKAPKKLYIRNSYSLCVIEHDCPFCGHLIESGIDMSN